MFKHIYLFELKYRLKRPATYIYFVILFLVGMLYGGILGGAFGPEASGMLRQGGQNLANSPYNIHFILIGVSQIAIFIIAAFMGVPIIRDYQREAHHLFFTKPISKWDYLGGRFAGSLTITLVVLLSIGLGMMLMEFMPFVNKEKYGPFNLMAYLNPYLVHIFPFALFTGSIFFSTVALSRNSLLIYLNAILVLVLLSIAGSVANVLENKVLGSLLDPTGGMAFMHETEYWTVEQKNSLLLPFSPIIVANQLIWVSVGLLSLLLTYIKFQFSYVGTQARIFRPKKGVTFKRIADTVVLKKVQLPSVHQSFSRSDHLRQLWILLKREFRKVVASPVFIILVVVAMLLFAIVAAFEGLMFGTPTLPLTYRMIDTAKGNFTLFILIIIVFYAGEMVWRERSLRVSPIMDVLPVPNWLSLTSKLLAMFGVLYLLMATIMLCGIVAQLVQGFFHIELGLYLQSLFGFEIWNYLIFACFAFFIQVLVSNKYFGFFLTAGIYLFINIFFDLLGIEHRLLTFLSSTPLPYSDMNGFGHFVWPFICFKIYWGALGVVMATLAYILWKRGPEIDLKTRWRQARQNVSMPEMATMALALLTFAGMGAYIYYNTNVLNTYRTSKTRQRLMAEFEKNYKRYEHVPQPKITGIRMEIDLYPQQQDFRAKGWYKLKNKSRFAIDSIHLNMNEWVQYPSIRFSKANQLVHKDSLAAYYIYQLDSALMPGDTLSLYFEAVYAREGFPHSNFNVEIVENGTFFSHYYFPRIGYESFFELQDKDIRKKYGLNPDRERFPSIDDTLAVYSNLISRDADWIDFEATVSTSPDQVAIVPGYLQKEWEKDGRRYFNYKMDAKMLKFFSIVSARYQVMKDSWQAPDGRQVSLEIYHHPSHTYNLERMMKGMKASLDYYTQNFGPYQHRQLRILEFPRYRSFAQSFANTVPFAESAGFIADVDEEDVDYPLYITAHETAHQWWAHQVVGGYVQGFQFLSESMSQYSALMVMEKTLGEDQIKKYLRHEMDTYLKGRTTETQKEMPALLSENQLYIHYNKGSVIMYALKDYLGEDTLNAALRRYVEAVKFQEPPYTTTKEWLQYVRAATPDSLQYVLYDMFETITLFDNRMKEATYEQVNDSTYLVHLKVSSKKLRDNGEGVETEVPVNDYMDIGIFGREKVAGKWQDVPLYFQKHRIDQAEQEFAIEVKQKPREAGIDPYYKLIDRNPADNLKRVNEQKNED